MNILVTGGAGYIGSHTVKELIKNNHHVIVLDNLSKGHRKAVLKAKFIHGDTGNKKLLAELLKSEKIEAIVHFAASSLVGESMAKPAEYYRNNLVNGLSILDAMCEAKVKCLVFSSTAAVYGEPAEIPILEDNPTIPANTYGATKLALESAMNWYSRAYGLRCVSLRYFNAAGADPDGELGEDHNPETHLIPLVLRTALGQAPEIKIFGSNYPTPDGTCVRDYIHVTDLAAAHILAVEALANGAKTNTYNLGNGFGYSVQEVIRTAEEVTGRELNKQITERRPGDPAVLVASSDKIKRELNWKPYLNGLRTIIETAWRWHKTNPKGYES
ncbi:MAG TPA: UDP-glucose 4-epimerase GalE [Desulfotomaculum sp.]|nr:UDP-glucose 4-epimerase GalE [Desulfotomaculum sp.]